MTPDRSALLERYRNGADVFASAIAGITDAELDARSAPDDWTAREIIHHLADAELRAAVRLRQLLAEDAPVIQGYDEAAYTRRLPKDRSIAISLDAVRVARASNLELLDRLTDADWERTGTHTESGTYSLATWLDIYAAHAHDHAEQLVRARATT